VLLLGSDHRTTGGGYRTDTMIVVSTVPETKEVSAVSVPRDVAQFPLPEGGVYGPKVNGLYSTYLERVGGEGHAGAGPLMKVTFANALGIEIDYYVFIGFGGVVELIDAVGGVEVTLEETYSDPSYQVSPSEIGVTFPAGVNQLDGERALIFARSRKGDNDFERARRQQLLVAAAVKAVAERGLDQLPELIEMAKPHISTDLPIEAYDLLFEVVGSSDVDEARREVLGPPTYAVPAGGTDYALQLEVVRDLAQELFGLVDGAE
nr:LCP family protein [Chloroflexota bacterium]